MKVSSELGECGFPYWFL